MSHPERVEDYLEHIADAIERAMRYIADLEDLAALERDEKAQDAVVRTLTVIGEAAARIHREASQFVTEHPELPWNQMRGIRNKVVHDYFDVAWDVVWDYRQTGPASAAQSGQSSAESYGWGVGLEAMNSAPTESDTFVSVQVALSVPSRTFSHRE